MKAAVAAFLALGLLAAPVAADVPVVELADSLSLDLAWDPFLAVGVIRDRTNRLAFDPERGTLTLNYERIVGFDAAAFVDGAVVFSDEAAAYTRELFDARKPDGGYVAAIVIDPGHGGKDPGANHVHTVDGERITLVEKDIVLGVARELHSMLEKRYPDRIVSITRDTDVYLALEERVAIANAISIDPAKEIMIFVSIHANASLNSKTFGYEVWYLPPKYGRTNLVSTEEAGESAGSVLPLLNLIRDDEYTNESVLLARTILDAFDDTVGEESRNLGLKEESWFVVRNAKMPSVLVELGYLTNTEEATRMADDAYLRKLTVGLYNGVTGFVDDFEFRYRSPGSDR
jgi:N-acetylmuramoyl-L-alanine amidase